MTTLGKYELHEILGKGGYGTVYRATDQSLGRVVVLKILHPQLSVDPEFIHRFQQEARIVASLEHPNIVGLYEIGEIEGRFYFAMKYLPGGSLADLLKQGSLSWKRAAAILDQVCAGLQQLHEQGWVHRDLKPSNILFDKDGRAVVGDFGLARALTISGSSASSTVGAGTPFYRAPELWMGKPPATPATDVYSLGCILGEMLTGRPLFAGDTPDQVLARHFMLGADFGENWPPEDAPAGVKELVDKTLVRDPACRFADAQSFATAVRDLQNAKIETTVVPSIQTIVSATLPIKSPKQVLSLDNGRFVCQLAQAGDGNGAIATVTYSPNGKLLAVGTSAEIYYYDPQDFTRIRSINVGTWVSSITFSPDNSFLAAAQGNSHVSLWRVSDGCQVQDFKGHIDWSYSVAFSPDGTLLASGSADRTIRLWQIRDGGRVRELKGHSSKVMSVVFSPDGALLASGSDDRTICLWRVSDGSRVRELKGHSSRVSSMAFSPDGVLLASGARDSTLRLWRVSDGSQVGELKGHTRSVTSVAFSPDGAVLASGSDDGTVRFWGIGQ
jgi:eukaryotic-like serine/threonine-protein kinase